MSTTTTKNFESFNNYITVANQNKNNLSLYFYIKNYCFRKMISQVSHDKNSFFPEESEIIQNNLKQFKSETQNLSIPPLSREQFCEFLERFYSAFNFDTSDLRTFEMSRDITEILSIYGPFDDLAKQRMDFFKRKISILESSNLNRNIPSAKPSIIPKDIKPVEKPKVENINQPVNIKSYQTKEEEDFANKLMTQSVVTHIEEIKTNSNDYLPKKVNKELKLPVVKSTPEYDKVKAEIISNIEDGMCELEYFNIDHAKEHVECALYYLRNVIGNK